jgi:hypothetical protein
MNAPDVEMVPGASRSAVQVHVPAWRWRIQRRIAPTSYRRWLAHAALRTLRREFGR